MKKDIIVLKFKKKKKSVHLVEYGFVEEGIACPQRQDKTSQRRLATSANCKWIFLHPPHPFFLYKHIVFFIIILP